MRANSDFLVKFVIEQLPGFQVLYSQTAPCGDEKQYHFRITGKVKDEKVLIFSVYKPQQIKSEMQMGYGLKLNRSNGHYVIDLKKI